MVGRGCWAEQPQPCSGSLLKERHCSYSPVCWSQSGTPGPEASSRRRICGPSLSLDSLWLKRPAAYGPGLLRAGPSGEERHTPQYTVPVSPQCPQEIGLPTLPEFHGAAVSSERFPQFLPPGNVAELRGSPPLWGSLERLVRLSPASVLFQDTSCSYYTRGQSRETGSLSRSPGGVGAPAKRVSFGSCLFYQSSLPRR